MSKKITRIISLLLVLCMLPITAIVASARGRGVYPNNTENQFIHNAENQFIPESVRIDGDLNDTAWPESGWSKVDSTNGYWNNSSQYWNHKAASYKYQIRADYEYVYIGARFALPSVNGATFTVLFKDSQESGNGYTDKIVFKLSNAGAEEGCFSIEEYEGITLSAADNNGALAPERSVIASKLISEGENRYYTLEFRNRIKDTFSSIENVSYYVSLDLTTTNNGTTYNDSLYHPLFARNSGVKLPDYSTWPVNPDGTVGGKAVETLYNNTADDLDYEVKVDGMFDEAVWSSLTDFYINGSKEEDAYNHHGDEYVKLDTYKYSDGRNNTKANEYIREEFKNEMKFKYEVRIDGEFLYGAVVAYVPEFTSYKGTSLVETPQKYEIATCPDLYVYFYDNERDVDAAHGRVDRLNEGDNVSVWPETVIQIRNYSSYYDHTGYTKFGTIEEDYYWQTTQKPSEIKCTYADVYPYGDTIGESVAQNGGTVGGLRWWGKYIDPDTGNYVEAEGTRAAWAGDIYTFEFKVPLEHIPTYDADGVASNGQEIVYGLCLGDRLQVNSLAVDTAYHQTTMLNGGNVEDSGFEGVNAVSRHLCWTGGGDYYNKSFYKANQQYDYGNYFTQADIAAAKGLAVADKGVFKDGLLAQEIWAGLSSADSAVPDNDFSLVGGAETANTDNGIDNIAYKITADHEFLYGAALIKGADADSTFTLWLKREMNDNELFAKTNDATASDGNYYLLRLKQQNSGYYITADIGANYENSNTTYNRYGNLTDGAANKGQGLQSTINAAGTFVAWKNSEPTLTTEFVGEHRVTRVDIYAATLEDWGIGYPLFSKNDALADDDANSDTFTTVEYYNGSKWVQVGYKVSETEKLASTYSGTPTSGYEVSRFQLDLNEAVHAEKIRIKVIPKKVLRNDALAKFIFLSEFTFYGEQQAYSYEHYRFRVKLNADGEIDKFAKKDYIGDIDNSGVYIDRTGGTDVDVSQENIQTSVKTNSNGDTVLEFRIPLRSLGIQLDLTKQNTNNVLFGYYVSTNDGNNNVLYYPKNEPTQSPSEITRITSSDYNGAHLFSYSDMLQDIVIDGELDEKYWIGDDKTTVEMTHVDSTSGSYEYEPKKGNNLSFDYKIYAGENYLYGAAVIDEAANKYDDEYGTLASLGTRFDIWIDNNIDEYEWYDDGNPYTVMEEAAEQYSDNSATANEQYQKYLVSLAAKLAQQKAEGEELKYTYMKEPPLYASQAYENYYYNIYLADNFAGSGSSGLSSVTGGVSCGGVTPNWYNDANNYGKYQSINGENWKWAINTINGKTYVEFMISLDNFHCDRSKGFNYYVSATHVYDEGTENEETLTLVYPSIKENTEDFWVTHLNPTNSSPEAGGGIIFTDASAFWYSLVDDEDDKIGAQLAWWKKALFVPAEGSGNRYKLVWLEIGDGKSAVDLTKGFLDGWDYDKVINTPDWFGYAAHGTSGTENQWLVLPEASRMNAAVGSWNVGDEFLFIGIDPANPTNLQRDSGATEDFYLKPEAQTGSFESSKKILEAGGTHGSDSFAYHMNTAFQMDGYECKYTVTRVEKGAKSIEKANNAYIANIPTATAWDAVNAGKIAVIEHFAPDVITVDGDLNENVWTEEYGWTDVHDQVNSSYQEGSTADTGAEFSYKLRFDDEYMYVGAIINAQYGEDEAPNFRIWIKTDDEATTYTHFYRIAYSEYEGYTVTLEVPDANYATIDGEAFTAEDYHGYRDGISYIESLKGVDYENTLVFGKNDSKTPVGATQVTEDNEYTNSALYGYNEEIQENTAWQFYPVIKSTKYYIGKESANMKATANGKTQVEFRVKLDEFASYDEETNEMKPFEYFVQAGKIVDGKLATLFYPHVYTEPKSKYCYWSNNQVYWEWFSNTAIKVGAAEMNEMKLRNHNYPVTTLGAKISSNYGGIENNYAIRFGGLYNEDYIRNWVSESKQTETEASGEYYTNPDFVDYWDIADVGIVIQPTDELSDPHGEDLFVGNDGSFNDSADNIVAWQSGKDGWGTNFADYENFAFYITIYGIPEEDLDRKFSFRGYVDFYASTGIESYYDTTFVRSYNIVDAAINGGSNEDSVLPEDEDAVEKTPVIAYIPLDDRPVNVDRIEFLTGATDFELLMPDKSVYATELDNHDNNPSTYGHGGNPEAALDWLKKTDADYYVLSLDQLCSGGLVHSRYETNTDHTFEYQVCDYIVELAAKKKVVVFDTVVRLASTDGYMGYDSETYKALRALGRKERYVLGSNDLTINNIVNNYLKDVNGNNITVTAGYEDEYAQHLISRERKLRITDYLLTRPDVDNLCAYYIGVDDSSSGNSIQTNEINYFNKLIESNDVNCHLFGGTDELGIMSIAACSNLRYGNVGFNYNLQYFGGTQNEHSDDFDYQTLAEGMVAHLDALGGRNTGEESADTLQVLVLTSLMSYAEDKTFTDDFKEETITAWLGQMWDYLEKGYPVCIIDGTGWNNYTAPGRTLCAQANAESTLGRLLGFSSWNTVGNSTGIALANAVSRFNYIKNEETVTDESNEAFLQTLTYSFVKDISYQIPANREEFVTPASGTGTTYTNAEGAKFLETDIDPTKSPNKYWYYAPQNILRMLENSDILVGLGETKSHGKDIELSDFYHPWNRTFEANFTITVN